MQHAIELLAPAGNAAALRAAVRGGADAVYLGLDSFNARRGADNFTLDTLADACAYAHLRGVRVYVTFNTAILPSEVTRALETVRQAYRAGADAFIVQDIGIASEIARSLPEARLHISTQMNTHNAAGIEAAARLGACRVTLARELSLPEIAHLVDVADGLNMEVESFAHGALCVCYSGQCFMSSLIGGRSANRGMCAQACRLPYTLHNKALRKNLPAPGEHLLSPQDLCAIDLLPQLVEAGVTSFKIEGRMKSPEYVFAVTSTYRAVLDRIIEERAASEQPAGASSVQATDEEHQTLAEAFSRGFTTAYLQGKRGNDIMSYGRPNNRGVFVGRVLSAKNGTATIAAERPLVAGDVLEFWTNKGHFAYTIDAVSLDAQGNVRVSPDRPVGKGDRVFRVRSAEAAFEDDLFEPRVAVKGRAGADIICVPALNNTRGEAVGAGQRSATAEQAGYPKQAVVALPTVEHDPVPGTREAALGFDAWRYVKPGKPVLVENLAGLVRAAELGAEVELGPHVPVTNGLSLAVAAELGAQRVWLSPELTLGQIADIAEDSPVELGLTIIGAQELMVTEHCLLMSQGPCDENCDECPRRKSPHYLRDRKEYEFPVITDAMGRSHLFNGVQLDVAQTLPDLIHAGVTSFMVDTTLMNVEETTKAVSRAVRARNVAHADNNAIAKTPGTTSGHLFRGVS